jgi:hypothetical protein
MWLDWSFLELGAFANITIPTSGIYGGYHHKLYHQDDPNYASGQVWQGFRQDWVWETGLSSSYQPIDISGVYVDGTFVPTGSAVRVEYPNGRVVFTTAVTGADVQLNYSYRHVQVSDSDSNSWFRSLYIESRSDDSHLSQIGSGEYDIYQQVRTQLPAVIIELVPVRKTLPYQLGDLTNWTYQNVMFHVIGSNVHEARHVADILFQQRDRGIRLFNVNSAGTGNVFPLDIYGSRASGAAMYPTLTAPTAQGGYLWKIARLTNTTIQSIGQVGPDLFEYAVRTDLELILP